MQLGHVIGVDQEGGVLRIVEARRRFLRPRVLNACRLRLPEDPGEARLVLERFARAHGFRRVPCVFGMSTETTLLRLFALPPARRRNLAQQVREKLEQFSTLPMEGALEAHTLLRSAGAGLRMLLGLTRRDALDRQLELPGAAGLNVVAAVPAPLAAFRAAASLWPRRKGAFLGLHLRRDKTLLAAGHGTDLLQLWTVPFGTDHLLPAEMPQDGGRELRNRWIQEVQACLEAFARETPADRPPIRTLLLSGAEPLPPDCITALARATERRVLRLENAPPHPFLPDLDRFAVAYGLALAGMGATPATLSLIPPSLKERLALRWQFKFWLGCAALLLLGLGLAAGALRRSLDRNTRACEAARRQIAACRELDETLRETTERNRMLRRQLHPLLRSVRKGAVMREILAALAEAKHADDWVSLIADGPSYFPSREPPRQPAAPDPAAVSETEARPAEHLVVEGFTPATDFSTIRAMIETLRSHPLVTSVDLLGDDKVMADEERDRRWAFSGARRFALEIKLNGQTSQ